MKWIERIGIYWAPAVIMILSMWGFSQSLVTKHDIDQLRKEMVREFQELHDDILEIRSEVNQNRQNIIEHLMQFHSYRDKE